MVLRFTVVALAVSALILAPFRDPVRVDRIDGPATGCIFAVLGANGQPARWDPRRTVRVVINPVNAPPGARRDLTRAVGALRRASGLTLRVVGETKTTPSLHYPPDPPPRGSWPPVLVAFVLPRQHLLADQGSSAETTSIHVPRANGTEQYVGGQILVNAAQNGLYDTRHGLPRVRLLEHELAHLLGLAHVTDPRSLMYPQILHRIGLTLGDRRGLRALGPAEPRSAPCLQHPAPRHAVAPAADKVNHP